MLPTVLVTAPCHPWLLQQLGATHRVLHVPEISYHHLLDEVHEAEGLVVTTRLKIDETVLHKAKRLKWIGRLGSGLELIDTVAAGALGIRVVSSPEGNRNAVAEHVLGMLLSLMNNIHPSFEEVKQMSWRRVENRGTELSGKTVGIVGFGNTGSQFARLLQPFDVTVLAYDRFRFDFAAGYVKEASLEQIQRYADVVSFHVPLNSETFGMANAAFFRSLQQRPWILNSSRGEVVVLPDLIDALKANQLRGAGLDVLPNEKLSSYTDTESQQLQWLTAQPNVIITPHIAGYSHEAHLRMAQVLYKKLFG